MSWIKDDSGMCAVEVTLIDWDSLRIILFYTQQEQVLAWHSTVLHCSLGNGAPASPVNLYNTLVWR